MPKDSVAELSDFRNYLQILVDARHKLHQLAWREFDSRYRAIILAKIHRITNNHSDVEEIIGEIMSKLVSNDFRALRSFREKDSEAAFRYWLSQVARTTALGYVKSRKKTVHLNEELPIEAINTNKQLEKDYQNWSKILGAALSGTKRTEFNKQRDIFICLLRRVAELNSKQVAPIPLVKTKIHNVDVIVARVEEQINKKGNDLRDLLE